MVFKYTWLLLPGAQTHLRRLNDALFACSFCPYIQIPAHNEIVGCLFTIILHALNFNRVAFWHFSVFFFSFVHKTRTGQVDSVSGL